MNRRDFIKNSGRWLLLTGLIATGGIGIFKNNQVEEKCNKSADFCRQCDNNRSCEFPQAKKLRNNEKRQNL